VSWRTQVRNGVLAAAAGVAVLAGRGASGLSPVRWAGQLNAAELGLAAAVAVLSAVAAGQGWFLYGLVRQNGRVLARLENLEQRIGIGGPPAAAGLAGVPHASGQGPVRGLAVGVPAPEFELPAADGRRVSLRALLGRGLPVLLVFSVPGCSHCDALLPQWPAGSTSIANASRWRWQAGDLPGSRPPRRKHTGCAMCLCKPIAKSPRPTR
jgi:AhpC/TSA family